MECELWGEKGLKGVKVVKAKGRGNCYQTGEQGGWEFVTTSKKRTGRAVHIQYAPIHVQKYIMYVRHVQYSQNMLCVQHFHLFFISVQFLNFNL